MPYILEVQKYNWNSLSEHVGYMNIVFETQQDACDYYNKFNPHMPQLSIIKRLCSDWDPKTYLMYVVREHFHEYLGILSFENNNNNNNNISNYSLN